MASNLDVPAASHQRGEPSGQWDVAAPEARAGSGRREAVRELFHDIRHPSATIRALAAAMAIESDLDEHARHRLDQIVAEAHRIDELCQNVLRGEGFEGLTRLDKVAIDVTKVMALEHSGVVVDASPVVAHIDEFSVRRILWNLLDNAVRAAGKHGQIVIAVWTSGAHSHLEVSDDGPGFGNAPSGIASLGLTIVGSLARRYGGWVEMGVSELGGALVHVVLPAPHIDLTVTP